MRLTTLQTQITKNTVDRILGASCKVWLFGSRTDDNAQGGDIDLMIETEETLPSRADAICRLYGALIMALGDRKLDIVLKDACTVDAPIFEIARRTGVLL
jgi:predicted nucleotidyltransferase